MRPEHVRTFADLDVFRDQHGISPVHAAAIIGVPASRIVGGVKGTALSCYQRGALVREFEDDLGFVAESGDPSWHAGGKASLVIGLLGFSLGWMAAMMGVAL